MEKVRDIKLIERLLSKQDVMYLKSREMKPDKSILLMQARYNWMIRAVDESRLKWVDVRGKRYEAG